MENSYPTFKVVLCGDAGVGKTSWIRRMLYWSFEEEYKPTIGVDVHTMNVRTTIGQAIKFDFIEVPYNASSKWNEELWNHHYLKDSHVDAGFIMFDLTSRITYKNVPKYYRDLVTRFQRHDQNAQDGEASNLPVLLSGNKADVKYRKVKAKTITFHRKKKTEYYDLSVKSNYNLDEPLLWLARKLMKDPDLECVGLENSERKKTLFGVSYEHFASWRQDYDNRTSGSWNEREKALAVLSTDDETENSTEAAADSISESKTFEPQENNLESDSTESKTIEPDTENSHLKSDSISNNLFIICIHCTRTIFIETSRSSTSVYSLATTTCRTCKKHLEKSESTSHLVENQVSAELIRSTRVYECCNRISGDGGIVQLLLDKEKGPRMVSFFSTDELADVIDTGDRIYSVRTESDVLLENEKLTRENLLLPYVLGGIL